ncbi:MAG: hydrogenase-4 component G [Desulfobacteraceae bacterium]|nr:hydrogenase-4 component G [Desulfobacteraceae bacterium]
MINTGYSINPFQNAGYGLMQTSGCSKAMAGSTTRSLSLDRIQILFGASKNTWQNTRNQGMIAQLDLFSLREKQELTVDKMPLASLTPEKVTGLLSEGGYYGVAKTSQRIADFVLDGAGDNMERLKQGREGILQGLKDAKKAWGRELPAISYKTIETAIKSVDDRINELGGNIIETTA